MIEFALILNFVLFIVVVLALTSGGYLTFYSGLFFYLAFHFISFVQRPIVVHLFDLRAVFLYMGYVPDDQTFLQTLFVANLGLLSFIGAYLWAIGSAPKSPDFQIPSVTLLQAKSFWLAFILLSPLILYSLFLAFTLRQGYGTEVLEELGQLNMTVDPTTGHKLFVDSTAYITAARNMLLAFGTILIVATRGRIWSYLPLLFSTFVALQIGERWLLIVSTFVIFLLVLYFRKRTTFTATQYIGLGIVLLIFMQLGQNRDTLTKFLLTGELNVGFDLAQSSFGDHLDFANFDFLTFVLAKVPDVSGTYSYFTQYLGLFTQPIPRMFWPDKPVGSPITWVNLQSYGHFNSLTTSLVGDGWISLGYAGVVITMSAFGAFYGRIYKHFVSGNVSIYYFCTYFWMVALLVQWARDGGYRILEFFAIAMGPLLLAYFIERHFSGLASWAIPGSRVTQRLRR